MPADDFQSWCEDCVREYDEAMYRAINPCERHQEDVRV
jgi:hypothetical protein